MARSCSHRATIAQAAALPAIAALAAACSEPEPPAMPPLAVQVYEARARDIPTHLEVVGQTRRLYINAIISLYKALGGGWSTGSDE